MKIKYSMNFNEGEKKELEQLNYKTIQSLLLREFIDSCERILIDSQSKFIDNYFDKISLIIKNNYGNNIFEIMKSLNKMIYKNKIYFINNIYSPMHKLCSLCIEYFNSNNNVNSDIYKISYLNNYRPHCMNEQQNSKNSNNAIHICGGKFLIITENSNEINSYVVCSKCKKCYFPSSIPMICINCYCFYYSEIIPECVRNENVYLATWSKYHCKNINNEKMSCIKCGEDFWLKNNRLFCKNCKFEIESCDIIWTCLICNEDFNSNAKVYNPLEFKEAQLILKEALIYKKIVKPAELPCKCFTNEKQIEHINFYHKYKSNEECKGLLYFCEINEKRFIICSLCFNIYSINKFKWYCPICFKSFNTMNIKVFKKMKHLKDKNNNNNNNSFKNSLKNNSKNYSFKNSSRKKEKTISILDTENSYNSKNNNNMNKKCINKNSPGNIYLSHNKEDLTNCNIKNIKSYIKKLPRDMHRVSSCYSSSSKDLLINNSHKNYIIKSDNNSNKKNNNIKKNRTLNNGCLYSLNIRKRRNLSETPNEIKNDNNFHLSKKNKPENRYNSGTGSTIFSSMSNYNGNSQKETIAKSNLEQISNGKNKIILNSYDDNNNTLPINSKKIINNYYSNINKNKKNNKCDNDECKNFYYKPNKRNNILVINNNTNDNYFEEYFKNNKIIINKGNKSQKNNNSINFNNINIFNDEFNSNILSSKNSKKMDYFKKKNFCVDANNRNLFEKKMNKRHNGYKSFYIRDRNYILFNLENDNKTNKENANNDKNKRNTNFNSKNIFKIKDSKLELKQKIPYNESNISKNNKKSKNEENNSINYYNINESKYKKNNKKKHYINNSYVNNITINNNSNFNIQHNNSMHSDYNLKKKKNISFEKLYKINKKNININIDYPKINNIYNYNISLSNEIKNALLFKRNNNSMNNKLNSVGEISNSQMSNSKQNHHENKLKQFNFNDYTIITQLGQGSFGKIYLVKDSKGNIFSMKKLLLSEELDVKSVINEYNMCYNLSHPNIIKILGIYSNKLDKTTYVVYVLMEVGISDWEKEINSYKMKKISYTESDLINILEQLISSLSFLQKNNISHRDIKPQNILIFKNKLYKLTDFGEARKIGEKDKNDKDAIQYSLKGTELYMSPLLFNGLRTGQIDIKHNTYKSDVYSLGLCFLYAATTNDRTLFEIRRMIEMEKIIKYININMKDKYSDKFINIIISMLEIHEQKRPDFIELEKILKNYW